MKKTTFPLLLIGFFLFFISPATIAQNKSKQKQSHKERLAYKRAMDYVSEYKDFAIEEMHRTGIPASITLAQGIHESNYGNSRLAVLANNHFGAKCHRAWKGPSIKHTDDAPDECFRKYTSVLDSYKDHSKILEKKRYASLFDLSLYDYKNWAHGLKKAGYATDPQYAYKLIAKIERYALYIYDRANYHQYEKVIEHKNRFPFVLASLESKHFEGQLETVDVQVDIPDSASHKYGILPRYPVQKINGSKYLRFSTKVYPVEVAERYNCSLEEVLYWNDLEDNVAIPAFTNIYLEERKTRAERSYKMHKVMVGQNLRDIAIKYAVNLEALKYYNGISKGKEPIPGEYIALRKNNDWSVKTYTPRPQQNKTKKNTPKQYQRVEPVEEHKSFLVETEEEEFRPIASPKKAGAVANGRVVTKSETTNTEVDKASVKSSPISNPVIENKQKIIKQNKPVFHYIQEGETLYSLSKQYNIDVVDLKLLNKMTSNLIQVNTVIRVR